MKETLLSLRGEGPPLDNVVKLCGECRKKAASPMLFLSIKEVRDGDSASH